MTAKAKIEKRLQPALELIVQTWLRRRALGVAEAHLWAGTREHGVQPNTVEALARRGLVEIHATNRRLVCRPTAAGLEASSEGALRQIEVKAELAEEEHLAGRMPDDLYRLRQRQLQEARDALRGRGR